MRPVVRIEEVNRRWKTRKEAFDWHFTDNLLAWDRAVKAGDGPVRVPGAWRPESRGTGGPG